MSIFRGTHQLLGEVPEATEVKANVTNLNNLIDAGWYFWSSNTGTPANAPFSGNNGFLQVIVPPFSSSIRPVFQICYRMRGGIPEVYMRRSENNRTVWSNWWVITPTEVVPTT